MMKRTTALFIILILAVCAVMTAPASAAGTASYSDYEKYRMAVADKIGELITMQGGLPYICFVDINGDGRNELVVDNSHGGAGTELAHSREIEMNGSHLYLVKGDCTVYCWNAAKETWERVVLSDNNMFVSYNARQKCLVAGVSAPSWERYLCLSLTNSGSPKLTEYMLQYNGNTLKSASKDSAKIDEWTASREVTDLLNGCMALSFTMYS